MEKKKKKETEWEGTLLAKIWWQDMNNEQRYTTGA